MVGQLMAIRWELLAPALGSNPGDAATAGFEAGVQRSALGTLAQNPNDSRALGALAMVNPQAAMQMRAFGQQQQAQEASRRAGALAASGDTAGARNVMLQAGNIEGAADLTRLDEQQAKAARERAQAMGGFLTYLQGVPYEQRRAVLQQRSGELQRSFGLTAEQIAAFDPNDQNIGALASQTRTAAEQLDAQYGGAYTIDGTRFDRQGNVQVQVPQYRPVEGVGLVEVPNQAPQYPVGDPRHVAAAPAPPPAPAPATEAELRAAAASAIERGADPAAVQRRLEEQLRGLGGASPSNGSGNFPDPHHYPPGQW